MKENLFQKKLIESFRKDGAWILNIHGHLYQKVGIPDLLVVHPRWTGFLELKVEKNKPSAIQCAVAKKIIRRLVPVYVLRCKEHGLGGENINQNCHLTIEDFNGNIISRPVEIGCILNVLSDMVPFYKIRKKIINAVIQGDAIDIGGKRFVCTDEDV